MDAQRRERERHLLALARSGASARGGRRGTGAARSASRGCVSPEARRAGSRDVHEDDVECLRALGAQLVGASDPDMPARLRAIPDCPTVLFVRGDRGALPAPQLAVVGSRRATPAGARIARRFAAELAERGLVVTSGLAQGIDAEAHRGALEAGGRTVAVLGSSLDRVYPSAHRALADRIAAQGAVVSEFPFGTRPVPWNFPWRNRIISGLSLGVLVVEAAERSGSLITARLAGEQGREVFAVPGSILNPQAVGCHRLLRDGAKLVERVEDILEELPADALAALESHEPGSRTDANALSGTELGGESAPPPTADEAAVLHHLGHEPASADALAERVGLAPERVYSILSILEIGGSIRLDRAGRYMRVS